MLPAAPAYQNALGVLMRALSQKDSSTSDHVFRVLHYALKIARDMPELDAEGLERLRLAAVLHDVGKIGIEDHILKKPSALDPLEWEAMRTHSELGHGMVADFEELRELTDVALSVRFHHERWDGGGYPEGLRGEEIPLIARIIAVADSFDAMVSERPYREAMSVCEAFVEVSKNSGTQFDPRVVQAFERAFVDDLVAVQHRASNPHLHD
jgi:HD-GYP domain-containing protein (c-di-GMP phosphodiesterase class II)